MILRFSLLLVLFSIPFSQAQVVVQDTVKMGYQLKETDTLSEPIQLEEITVYKERMDPAAKKEFLLLQNRVYKVYPFAKIAAERLQMLNKNLTNLKGKRERKQYFSMVESYMDNEFKDRLKKLSRKQGQILVKLICRQTGVTTYDLIKNLKSGWTAFWSNGTAKLFDINLKTPYVPYEDNEDFLIETILYRAFNRGRLIKQEAATPIDYSALSDFWEAKVK